MNKKTIDLRQAPRDEDGKLFPALGTSRESKGNDTSRQLPQFYRDYEKEIYLFVSTSDRAVTRQEICKELKLKKAPWLIDKIERLVEMGFLNRIHGTWRNGALVFFYEVNE